MVEKKYHSKIKRIGFMGASLDTGNMGVSALAASVVSIILNLKPDAEILLFIGNRSSQPQEVQLSDRKIKISVVNYRLSPKARLSEHLFWILVLAILWRIIPLKYIQKKIIQSNRWLSNLDSCDFVGEICGGDSFSDIYNIRRFIFTILPDIIVLLMKKELILLPQTYGPYKSFLARRIAQFLLKHAKYIYARDKEGLSVVEKLMNKPDSMSNLSFCPDVAFSLDSVIPKKQDIEPQISTNQMKGLIGININGLLYNGGYSRANMFGLKLDYQEVVQRLIQQLLDNTTVDILFVPHTFGPSGNINSDPDATKAVYEMIELPDRQRIHRVTSQYSPHELKGIINQCNFFIGSRMHACIAALSQHIPTVGIAYSRKFIGVFNSIGVSELVIDARNINTIDAIEKVINLYQSRENYIAHLKDNVNKAKELLTSTFKSMLTEM